MRQAGRYLPEYRALRARAGGFVEFCLTPDLAAEATLQPVRRFGMDAAILFADILLIAQALGTQLDFGEDGPALDRLDESAGIGRLSLAGIASLDPVYETVRRVRGGLPDGTALIGFAGAPWTVATYMVEGGASRDFRLTRSWAYRDPEGFAALIDLIAEANHRLSVGADRGGRRGGAAVRQLGRRIAGTRVRALGRRRRPGGSPPR